MTAKWAINSYAVTFSDGVATQNIEYNSKATEPEEPTKAGYTFDGWYNGDSEFDFDTPITANVSLTAKWTINTYDVTFSDGVATQNIDYNSTATEPEEPTKTGYTFAGWYNGDTEFDFTTPITANISLTAKWTLNSYAVTFSDGVASQNIEYNSTATEPEEPTKTGYTFAGWYNGNFKFEFDTPITAYVSLTAKWTINTYAVTFSDGVASQNIDYNSTATEPEEPTKTGYTFNGWYNSNSKFEFDTPITDNVSLTAKWTVNSYTVTFSDGVTYQTIDYNSTATEPEEPTKTGYTFNGWYNGNSKFEFDTPITANISLAAKWTADIYNIFYYVNGIDYSFNTNTYTYGTGILTIDNPLFTGYTFNGWYDNGSYTGSKITGIGATETGNKTLYGQTTINTYAVTFSDDVATQTIQYNSKASEPEEPTKAGYTFDGWYNGDSKFDFDTPITADVSLTAKWERIELTMLEGENQEWEQGSSEDLRFRSEALLSDFENVTINGSIVDESNYTKESGSTIITLNSDYLETLSAGTYTLAINSTTGSATTEFTINEEAVISDDTTDNTSSTTDTEDADDTSSTTETEDVEDISSTTETEDVEDTSSTTDTEDVEDTSSTADTEDVEDTSSTSDSDNAEETTSTTESEETENPKTGSNILTSLMMLSGLSAVAFVFAKKKIK